MLIAVGALADLDATEIWFHFAAYIFRSLVLLVEWHYRSVLADRRAAV
jgi:hypothetical protein